MKRFFVTITVIACTGWLSGCAASVADAEPAKPATVVLKPIYKTKPDTAVIDLYYSGSSPDRPAQEIGFVSARALELDKGIEVLKGKARLIGADAIIEIRHERRYSSDYLRDLYFIDGKAVVYKPT